MKYLLFIFFPVCAFSQVDSMTYEKRDTQWYKITIKNNGIQKTTIEEKYTTNPLVVKQELINELSRIAVQFNELRLKTEEQEKYYLNRLKSTDKVYREIYGKRPETDSIYNANQMIGAWMLNDVEISITKQLKLGGSVINFVSENLFWIANNGREYFFKRGDNWISDKSKLIRVKKS
jgi:hypothetical protein